MVFPSPPASGESLRILLALRSEVFADALRVLLSEYAPTWKVVGVANHGEAISRALCEGRVDVIVFDPDLPGLAAPVLEELVRGHEDGARLLALDFGADGARSWELLRRGASAYLDTGASTHEFLQALEAVGRGECFLSSRATRGVIERMSCAPAARPGLGEVTPREREILHLVAEGLSSREIAEQLGVSVRTVETHRVNLLDKLRATNTAHLVRVAIRERLIGL